MPRRIQLNAPVNKSINVYMPVDLLEEINRQCVARNEDRSPYIVRAIRYYREHAEKGGDPSDEPDPGFQSNAADLVSRTAQEFDRECQRMHSGLL